LADKILSEAVVRLFPFKPETCLLIYVVRCGQDALRPEGHSLVTSASRELNAFTHQRFAYTQSAGGRLH
jgi:hypothetical protein